MHRYNMNHILRHLLFLSIDSKMSLSYNEMVYRGVIFKGPVNSTAFLPGRPGIYLLNETYDTS